MKEQIEEIWDIITTDCDNNCGGCKFENDTWCFTHYVAEHLYNAGYRKQKEGKWIVSGMFDDFLKCSSCGYQQPWQTAIEYKYCADCGAKMKGGAE